MTYRESYHSIRQKLSGRYDKSEAAAIAALLLEAATGLSKTEQLLKQQEALPAVQEAFLLAALQKVLNGKPVQYVLKKAWFYGMELYVDESVLIPRPETEELVQWIVADVKEKGLSVFEKKPAEADRTGDLKIIDIGTGSGCIALALKKKMPLAEVWGCDVSDAALTVARRNGAALDIRVDFQSVNFLDEAQQKSLPTAHIIVSNPPYIPAAEGATMADHVVKHEPHKALFVPDEQPLLFYNALARFGRFRLYEGGAVYAEVHESYGPAVAGLFEEAGYNEVVLKKDMQGKDRMVKAII